MMGALRIEDVNPRKKEILDRLVARLDQDLQQVRASYEHARATTVESPGRMQSRYDTAGIEAAWVADGLAKQFNAKGVALEALKKVVLPEAPARVVLGCLVGIGEEADVVEGFFFLLPACGGMTVPMDGSDVEIRVVTPGTPVARQLVGKHVGETVAVRKERPGRDLIVVVI